MYFHVRVHVHPRTCSILEYKLSITGSVVVEAVAAGPDICIWWNVKMLINNNTLTCILLCNIII